MMKRIILLILLFIPFILVAQTKLKTDAIDVVPIDNDSMIFIRLEQIDVYPQKGQKLNYRQYSRLVTRIRKVYPFAKSAAYELEKYNEKFENAKSDREKRKYVRQIESKLFSQHEAELKRFTVSEGRYLMLLIDRESGNSTYSIIKEIKGGVPALFWQGIAKIFNNDLKEEYDSVYKHYVIEQIVLMIEQENSESPQK